MPAVVVAALVYSAFCVGALLFIACRALHNRSAEFLDNLSCSCDSDGSPAQGHGGRC
jgi:hypothetical protein